MGAPHQFDGVKTLSPRAPSRHRRKPTLDRSVVERRVLFWLAVLVLVVLALWLGVLTRFALRHYLQRSVYTGEEAD